MGSDYLYTLAEVAVAFVGFSAIVGALRQRNSGPTYEDQVYMSALVERSLAVVAFSMLPSLLHSIGLQEGASIAISSLLLSVYMVLTSVKSIRYHQNHPLVVELRVFWTRVGISWLVAAALLGNALGFNNGHPVGVYMIGVSLALLAAGLSFVALLHTQSMVGFEGKVKKHLNVFGKEMEI